MKDLPPAVTKKSSKKKLWEELQCAGAEIDSQQEEIIALRKSTAALKNELGALRYQIGIIKAALNVNFSQEN